MNNNDNIVRMADMAMTNLYEEKEKISEKEYNEKLTLIRDSIKGIDTTEYGLVSS